MPIEGIATTAIGGTVGSIGGATIASPTAALSEGVGAIGEAAAALPKIDVAPIPLSDAASLAGQLDAKLGTPDIGIQDVASFPLQEVHIPEGNSLGQGLAGTPSEITSPDGIPTPDTLDRSAENRISPRFSTEATNSASNSAATPDVTGDIPPPTEAAVSDGNPGELTIDKQTGSESNQTETTEPQTPVAETATTMNSPEPATANTVSGRPGETTTIPVDSADSPPIEYKPTYTATDTAGETKNPNQTTTPDTLDRSYANQTDPRLQSEVQRQTVSAAEQILKNARENKSPNPENTKRTAELESKVMERRATAAEITELRNLKQDPEQLRQGLEKKALEGTITDEEAQQLGKLNSAENPNELTPELQAEKLDQDIDKLGTDLMTKIANGQEVTEADLEQLRNLRGQEQLTKLGFTPEQAKAAMRSAVKGEIPGSERISKHAKEVQEKIQELMAIEMQIMSIPKNIDALRKQRSEVRDKAQEKHTEAKGQMTDERRFQVRAEEYSLLMQIANINGAITQQKYMGPVLEAKRQDIEQYVRRKVGVTSGIGALIEWGAAKTNTLYTNTAVDIQEDLDNTFGIR